MIRAWHSSPTQQSMVAAAPSGFRVLTLSDQPGWVPGEFFKSQEGKRWQTVEAGGTLLFDQNATYLNVQKAFEGLIQKNPQPDDTIIVYISSHGVPLEINHKKWFFAALHDSSNPPVSLNNQSEVKNLLSEVELAGWLSRVKANTLLIMDTCFSGSQKATGVVPPFSQASSLQERVSTRDNTAIWSSTDGKSASFEEDQYEHGVFTYHLLNQLRAANTGKLIRMHDLAGPVANAVFEDAFAFNLQKPEVRGNSFLEILPPIK